MALYSGIYKHWEGSKSDADSTQVNRELLFLSGIEALRYKDCSGNYYYFYHSGIYTSKTITAGSGLVGGGDLSADRIIDVVGSGAIIVYDDRIYVDETLINHDNLSGYEGNEHIDHTSVSFTAGSGLTGGGDLSSNRVFDVGQGTGIFVSNDFISTNDSEIVHDNLSGYESNEHIDHSSVSIIAGSGLSGGGDLTTSRTFDVSADYSVISANDSSTDVTGAELEELTDGTQTTLHTHSGIFPSAHASTHESSGSDTINHDNLLGFVADEHIAHSTISISGGGILSGGGTIDGNQTISLAHGDVDHDQTTNYVPNEHINHTSVTLTAGNGLTGGGDISANRSFAVGAGTGIGVNANDIKVSADYSVISGNDSDTDITGLELEELTDGSETSLHTHSGGISFGSLTSGYLTYYDGSNLANSPMSTDGTNIAISGGTLAVGSHTAYSKFSVKQSADTAVGGAHFRQSGTNDTWAIYQDVTEDLVLAFANNASGGDGVGDFTDKFVFEDSGTLELVDGGLISNASSSAMIGFPSNYIDLHTTSVAVGTHTPYSRLSIKQSSDDYTGGIHLRQSATNDTWALVQGSDENLYFGYANNASGGDAAGDFAQRLMLESGGDITVQDGAAIKNASSNADIYFKTNEVEINATTIDVNGVIDLSLAKASSVPLQTITNTTASTDFLQSLQCLAPSLGANHFAGLTMGTAFSAKNAAQVGFYNAGAGSDANFLYLAFHSADDLFKLYPTGHIEIKDGAKIANTSANADIYFKSSEVEINAATLDFNGAVDISSTLTVADNISIADGKQIKNATSSSIFELNSSNLVISNGTEITISTTTLDINAAVEINDNITMVEDKWIGLGSSNARVIFDGTAGAIVIRDCDITVDDAATIQSTSGDASINFEASSDILGLNAATAIELDAGSYIDSQSRHDFNGEIRLSSIKTHTDTSDFNADLDGHNVIKWVPPSGPGGDVEIDLITNANSEQFLLVLNKNEYDSSNLEFYTGNGSDGVNGNKLSPAGACVLYYDGTQWWIINNIY